MNKGDGAKPLLGTITPAEQEMIDGYMDGFKRDNPLPGPNRSAAYRHGFLNARDDVNHAPRDRASVLRARANMILDSAETNGASHEQP